MIPQTGRVRNWIFQLNGQTVQIAVPGRFWINHPEALLETAIAGGGLIQLYNFLVRPAIARKELKPVLEAFAPSGSPIAVLYPPKRHLSAKVRAFIDFMNELTTQLREQRIVE
ncbi:hypothetical protein B7486_53290 [cyanobacterium TDX16]|nr:hypothetical protein B7486_53290 [cyanobacterium TDX16]